MFVGSWLIDVSRATVQASLYQTTQLSKTSKYKGKHQAPKAKM
jgi:hypothetical protein